jgi:hypothetical protein
MQAQFMPQKGQKTQPKLSKQKTKEVFIDSEEKKLESMKKMMSQQ